MYNMMIQKPWAFSISMMLAMAILMLPELGLAGDGETVVSNVLCRVVNWFTGSVGKGIATLAIIIIGVGALMGKVSWGMAIIVGIGVAVIFGAASIVDELGDTGSSCYV